jgi:uncharacterized Zn finger protein
MMSFDVYCAECGYMVFQVVIHRNTTLDFQCQKCGVIGTAKMIDESRITNHESQLTERSDQ